MRSEVRALGVPEAVGGSVRNGLESSGVEAPTDEGASRGASAEAPAVDETPVTETSLGGGSVIALGMQEERHEAPTDEGTIASAGW